MSVLDGHLFAYSLCRIVLLLMFSYYLPYGTIYNVKLILLERNHREVAGNNYGNGKGYMESICVGIGWKPLGVLQRWTCPAVSEASVVGKNSCNCL